MSNFLVETKNEYTTHLVNILTPLIFEGLQSIYKESLELAGTNDILKIFQSCLKRIPKWNQSMVDKETNRILTSTHSYNWLNDLIKATLKATLIVLMYNPTCKIQTKINPSFYQDIKTSAFIHTVYIECARELWNNPYLLYHNYPPIEIKRNQRDCMNIIKDCIKEALRKLLPVKHILQVYLGEDMQLNNMDDQFEKVMTDAEEHNLTKLIQKDLANDNVDVNDKHDQSVAHNSNQSPPTPTNEQNTIHSTESEDKTIGSKILNIINNSDTSPNIETSVVKPTNPLVESDANKSDHLSEIAKSIGGINSQKDNHSIDDKIKKILQKDLATDTDLETSLNYSQEENENKYQEIFSNSNLTPKNNAKPNDSKNLKDKKKFFNNYLQF
jgi:hypothetical protein